MCNVMDPALKAVSYETTLQSKNLLVHFPAAVATDEDMVAMLS